MIALPDWHFFRQISLQPSLLTPRRLLRQVNLPLDWHEQKALSGSSPNHRNRGTLKKAL
jgi:hypothetical protein